VGFLVKEMALWYGCLRSLTFSPDIYSTSALLLFAITGWNIWRIWNSKLWAHYRPTATKMNRILKLKKDTEVPLLN